MQKNRPFRVLSSSRQLGDALNDLENTAKEIDAIRDKLQKLETRSASLFESVLGEKGAKANSLMVSARHKFRMLQTNLQKSLKVSEQAQKEFETAIKRLDATLDQHNRFEAVTDLEAATRQRSAHFFRKGLRELIRLRLEQVEDQIDKGNFVLPEESHGYIPFQLETFVEQLIRVDELLTHDPDFLTEANTCRPVSFLEIGCGQGRNLLVAKMMGVIHCNRYRGFDLNDEMVQMGKLAFGLDEELFVADALTFDYAGHDVIFSYRPIRVPELQIDLEQQIVSTMDTGAYLIAPTAEDLGRYRELRSCNYSLSLWKKIDPPDVSEDT